MALTYAEAEIGEKVPVQAVPVVAAARGLETVILVLKIVSPNLKIRL